MILDEEHFRFLVYGGAVLGAGGGGSLAAGLAAMRQALDRGMPRLIDIDQLPPQATLVTFSTVGPALNRAGADRPDGLHGQALQLLRRWGNSDIQGVIASEVGPLAATYGALESASGGIPLVDAPANGRAHPLGLMGSLGLHRFPRRSTITVAMAGRPGTSTYVQLAVAASATHAATIVRRAAADLGVPLAVVRNPLPASYVRRHAAVGGLSYAMRVGEVLLSHFGRGLSETLRALAKFMGGAVIAEGAVDAVQLVNRGGLSIGAVALSGPGKQHFEIAICNEYMMVAKEHIPLAVFPDLVVLFDEASSLPLGSFEVQRGMRVAVLSVPCARLKLGSPMADRRLLRPVERALGMQLHPWGLAQARGYVGTRPPPGPPVSPPLALP